MQRQSSFFDFFEQHCDTTLEACRIFQEITANGSDLGAQAARIKRLEHQADDITHQCLGALHQTFVTPIDRHDILFLIKRMDDIIDDVDSAAARLVLYELTEIRSEAGILAQILMKACTEMAKAVRGLRHTLKRNEIRDICIKVQQFENEGDQAMQAAVVRLFKEASSPHLIIIWKEIFEMLERATDCCKEVANIIEGIVIEAS